MNESPKIRELLIDSKVIAFSCGRWRATVGDGYATIHFDGTNVGRYDFANLSELETFLSMVGEEMMIRAKGERRE